MSHRVVRTILIGSGVAAFGILMFAAGYVVARPNAAPQAVVQALPVQTPPPIQEMIPLAPGPGQG
ncbi:MAG: hypothetical protein ACRDFA_02660, partial [bacterium]